MSIENTLELLNSGYSLSRMGDGEYNLCFNQSISFQKSNEELSRRLRNLLKIGRDDTIKYLVGIPRLKFNGRTFWGEFWFFHLKQISTLLDNKIVYGDLGISRHIEIHHILELTKIWDKKNVLFIFGKGSKFNIEHEIFNNTNKKFIIESVNKDAFYDIETISQDVRKYCAKVDLILISLGPTASILAYDYCLNLKIQVIDIGHLTNVIDFKLKGVSFRDG